MLNNHYYFDVHGRIADSTGNASVVTIYATFYLRCYLTQSLKLVPKMNCELLTLNQTQRTPM